MNLGQSTWNATHMARHANPILKYDGIERKELYVDITSLEYTDFAEGSSDEIIVKLGDQKKIFWGGFFPEKGKDLDMSIDYYNWFQPETKATYHCGSFTVDDITLSGGPRVLTMKGVSQPANSEFKDTPRTKTWKETTLKTIVIEMMTAYGMTNLYFYGDDPVVKEYEQKEQDDASFLNELCEKYGFCLKIYKVGFVIYKKSIYESRPPVKTYQGETEWESGWEWNTTLAGTYTGARISYTNPNKPARRKKGEEPVPDIEVMVGTEGRILELNETADTEAEAIEIARAKVNKENEKIETLSFTTKFDPLLVASANIEVIGIPRVEGKYFLDQIRVRMTGSGLKMQVSAYKIVQRL